MAHPQMRRPWYSILPTMALPGDYTQTRRVLDLAEFENTGTEPSRIGSSWDAWTKDTSTGLLIAGLEHRCNRLFVLKGYDDWDPGRAVIDTVHTYFDARRRLQTLDECAGLGLWRRFYGKEFAQIVSSYRPVLTPEGEEPDFILGREALAYVTSQIPIVQESE